uniref:NADP-dependent oxidoreductase domain-containing protein n=1 Tax=Parascaris equorum TaxID=6256 RepID=A0A914S2H2_PAREQ
CGPIGGLFDNIEDSITQIVECAIKSGINFIDTAYWYGQGRSEEILGKIFRLIEVRSYRRPLLLLITRKLIFAYDSGMSIIKSVHRICERRVHCVRVLFTLYAMVVYNIHDVEFAPHENIILYE